MLEARDITFSYDGQRPVLDSISLQIQPGEIVIITGTTGVGKSTLAKVLSGFIPHLIEGQFSGSLYVNDIDMTSLNVPEMSRHVGLVQQDPDGQICTLQVSDEVAFGPENYLFPIDKIQSIVQTSLSALDAQHLISRSTTALSGGERQRITISSMLACSPKYLILDEPSSSLDIKSVIKLREVLRGLKERGLGVLCFEHKLQNVLPVADRVLQLTEKGLREYAPHEPVKSKPKQLPVTGDTNLLQAHRLSFSYDTSLVVTDVTLSVGEGEVIALMGDNGSGKTTLLHLLCGLLPPDSGTVHLISHDIQTLSPQSIAKDVAVVFQNPNHQIFERTVWREQILPVEILGVDSDAYTETSKHLLATVGLTEMRDRNPFSLSHGQKRRLNITSVIAHGPRILLFDEPFIGQDQEGRDFIIRTISKHAYDDGVCIIATHDLSFARNHCTRLIFMEAGAIVLDGTPDTVIDRLRQMEQYAYIDSIGGGT